MTNATQTFTFDMEAELACTLKTTGNGRDEPKATDIEDDHVTSVTFLGTKYDRDMLLRVFGKFGAEALMQIITDAALTDEWETE